MRIMSTESSHPGQENGLFASDEIAAVLPESGLDTPLAARMRPRTLDEFAGQEGVAEPGPLWRESVACRC